MKILYLTTVLPSGRKTGGEIASQCFINALKYSGHQVLVVGYQRPDDINSGNGDEIVVEQRYIETEKSKYHPFIWMALSIGQQLPYSAAKYYSKTYLTKIKNLLEVNSYDIIIIDHAQLGWLLPLLDQKSKVIFIAHNVEHQLYETQLKNAKKYLSKYIYKREARLIKKIEDHLATFSKQVWTLTSDDSNYFYTQNKSSKVFHLPSSWTIPAKNSAIKNYDIGIIGSWTWKANKSGLEWFFQAVYPHLPTNISIHVAGSGAKWLIERYPNVKYCGFVTDAQAFMGLAKVIAIPSISGGGIQIKTLDAIASGSPIVATNVAMRGISSYPCAIKIADDPKSFARSLMQLLAFKKAEQEKLLDNRLTWSVLRREHFYDSVKSTISSM
ncbi:MAG: glycosyltransferase family 4 protein [Richelia sp. RM2_1_2]|nr:glycosyltransferase family 4 protein [Richelia sp. SM1_7_0]NJN09063.1 glycosyltransferase family 4 protein [Richelia sp. RM1_1_1]NJO26826.1 glycosyltransferase family 4 protein [Richelia sp. SL_2_1]NJO58596.1 glycosyltransferase family 4 protein [Richelia sp. RM2_1_2]